MKLDLTQEQLAERLGVSFATVNRWEGGSNLPQKAAQEVIAALAQEAGLSPGEAPADMAAPAAGVTRPRRGAPAVPTTKPMEQMLWDATVTSNLPFEEWTSVFGNQRRPARCSIASRIMFIFWS